MRRSASPAGHRRDGLRSAVFDPAVRCLPWLLEPARAAEAPASPAGGDGRPARGGLSRLPSGPAEILRTTLCAQSPARTPPRRLALVRQEFRESPHDWGRARPRSGLSVPRPVQPLLQVGSNAHRVRGEAIPESSTGSLAAKGTANTPSPPDSPRSRRQSVPSFNAVGLAPPARSCPARSAELTAGAFGPGVPTSHGSIVCAGRSSRSRRRRG